MHKRIDAPTPADRVAELLRQWADGRKLMKAEELEIDAFSKSMQRRICKAIRHPSSKKGAMPAVTPEQAADVMQGALCKFMQRAKNSSAQDRASGALSGGVLLLQAVDAVADEHRRSRRMGYLGFDEIEDRAHSIVALQVAPLEESEAMVQARWNRGLREQVERAGLWIIGARLRNEQADVIRFAVLLQESLARVTELERDLVGTVAAQLKAEWGNDKRVRNAVDRARRRPPIARILKDFDGLFSA